MISIEQLNGEIAVLEAEHPTHIVMQKLASLYIVRDHIGIGNAIVPGTQEEAPADVSQSEFMQAVRKKTNAEAWAVMDELASTLSVVNSQLYQSVLRKLNKI